MTEKQIKESADHLILVDDGKQIAAVRIAATSPSGKYVLLSGSASGEEHLGWRAVAKVKLIEKLDVKAES